MTRIAPIALLALALAAALFYSQWREEPPKVSGFIEADEIRIGSRVGGRVARVAVEEGQAVSADEVLVELDPFDLLERRAEAAALLEARKADLARLEAGYRAEEIAQARARRDQWAARVEKLVAGPRRQEIAAAHAWLEAAEAQLQLAQSLYARAEAVFSRSAATREDLDRAAEELKAATAAVAVRQEEVALLEEGTRSEEIAEARAQLDEAEQAWAMVQSGFRAEEIAAARASVAAAEAQVAQIARQIDELTIRAPVDGTVEAVELQRGDLVGANAPVLSMMDHSTLWVRAYVPEARLSLTVGQVLRVTVDSFPGQTFRGRVTFISRQAEFTPSNVQTPEERSKQVFRIKVTLEEGLDRLRPGMSADVWLEEQP